MNVVILNAKLTGVTPEGKSWVNNDLASKLAPNQINDSLIKETQQAEKLYTTLKTHTGNSVTAAIQGDSWGTDDAKSQASEILQQLAIIPAYKVNATMIHVLANALISFPHTPSPENDSHNIPLLFQIRNICNNIPLENIQAALKAALGERLRLCSNNQILLNFGKTAVPACVTTQNTFRSIEAIQHQVENRYVELAIDHYHGGGVLIAPGSPELVTSILPSHLCSARGHTHRTDLDASPSQEDLRCMTQDKDLIHYTIGFSGDPGRFILIQTNAGSSDYKFYNRASGLKQLQKRIFAPPALLKCAKSLAAKAKLGL